MDAQIYKYCQKCWIRRTDEGESAYWYCGSCRYVSRMNTIRHLRIAYLTPNRVIKRSDFKGVEGYTELKALENLVKELSVALEPSPPEKALIHIESFLKRLKNLLSPRPRRY